MFWENSSALKELKVFVMCTGKQYFLSKTKNAMIFYFSMFAYRLI